MAKSKRRRNGTKTYGRNKTKCEWYRKMRKHEKSHIRRLTKHLVFHKNDLQAKEALEKYQDMLSAGGR